MWFNYAPGQKGVPILYFLFLCLDNRGHYTEPLINRASTDRMNVGNADSDDEEWITINGTPVKVENGELQGEVGEKIVSGEGMDYTAINDKVKDLINQGIVNPNIGEAKEPVPAKIESINKYGMRRGITKEETQGFIDNAVVMFDQQTRSLYVSHEGNAVLLDKEKRVISAYRKEDFDDSTKAILEVLEYGS